MRESGSASTIFSAQLLDNWRVAQGTDPQAQVQERDMRVRVAGVFRAHGMVEEAIEQLHLAGDACRPRPLDRRVREPTDRGGAMGGTRSCAVRTACRAMSWTTSPHCCCSARGWSASFSSDSVGWSGRARSGRGAARTGKRPGPGHQRRPSRPNRRAAQRLREVHLGGLRGCRGRRRGRTGVVGNHAGSPPDVCHCRRCRFAGWRRPLTGGASIGELGDGR